MHILHKPNTYEYKFLKSSCHFLTFLSNLTLTVAERGQWREMYYFVKSREEEVLYAIVGLETSFGNISIILYFIKLRGGEREPEVFHSILLVQAPQNGC